MGYTYYNPLKVWLDPASIADVVSYMQTYLEENPIKDTEEINQIIADYITAHPEIIGGVQSVNGETGTVVLTASDINTTGQTTIQEVLTSLSSQISEIAQTVTQNTNDITDLKSAFDDVFTIVEVKSVNRLNPSTVTSGAYIGNSGNIISESKFGYSDYIEVSDGDIIRCTYWTDGSTNRGVFYNANKEKVSAITSIPDLTDHTDAAIPYWECTVPTGAVYVRVNVRFAQLYTKWMVLLNTTFPTSYIAYTGDGIRKSINSNVDFTMPYNPKLYKKNIMFCGDSITYGTYADIDEFGYRKNFGYYIKQQTGCNDLYNAVAGSTMMNVTGKNPFSVNRYQQLGDNLDYIVLAFSTNDSAQSNDLIGSSSDNTNETFWGAWKIVLNYLIANYPTAKIGIIAFWRGNQKYLYTDALREIAYKYRIPLLDFMFDVNVPMVGGTDFRSYNPNAPFIVDTNILQARQSAFLHDSIHPNDAGYRYMASIIQSYLERL